MRWLQIPYSFQENLYVHWRKWGRKFRNKHQQKVAYASLAATVYHIWRTRNYALWNDVVWNPDVTIEKIKCEIVIRAKTKICNKWRDRERNWFENLMAAVV